MEVEASIFNTDVSCLEWVLVCRAAKWLILKDYINSPVFSYIYMRHIYIYALFVVLSVSPSEIIWMFVYREVEQLPSFLNLI